MIFQGSLNKLPIENHILYLDNYSQRILKQGYSFVFYCTYLINILLIICQQMFGLSKVQRYCFGARIYSNFYNGEFVPSKATKFYDHLNPVTQELVGRAPQSSQEEFNAIVASAKDAFKTWSRVPLLSKSTFMQLVNVTCSILPLWSEEIIKFLPT